LNAQPSFFADFKREKRGGCPILVGFCTTRVGILTLILTWPRPLPLTSCGPGAASQLHYALCRPVGTPSRP
jgi:hypothetical protein